MTTAAPKRETNQPQVAIRADASLELGAGHVGRCRALAEHLRYHGWLVHWICRRAEGDSVQSLRDEGWSVSTLDCAAHDARADQAQTYRALEQWGGVDWLVVDHYSWNQAMDSAIRPVARRIAVIDDVADRRRDADLVINPNLGTSAGDYSERVATAARLAVGPRWALLRREFSEARGMAKPRNGRLNRVFVCLGGGDNLSLTTRVARELASIDRNVAVDFVNRAAGDATELDAMIRSRPGWSIHAGCTQLANLMNAADLAIGAGGTMNWERCCVGLPTLVITTADNQTRSTRALAETKAIRYLGASSEIAVGDVARAVSELASQPEELARMSQAAWQVTDGLGAARTASLMAVPNRLALRIRRATPADVTLYYDWACDPEVRRQSFHSAPIPWSDHCRWFADMVSSPRANLFVIESQFGAPLGQVRFVQTEAAAETYDISFSIDCAFRGLGLGRRILELALAAHASQSPQSTVRGYVKPNNRASRHTFVKLRFDERRLDDRFCFEAPASRFAQAAGSVGLPRADRQLAGSLAATAPHPCHS